MDAHPKPSRLWPRFSLRTLFVVVTVAAFGLSWLGRQVKIVRERQLVLSHMPYCPGGNQNRLPWAWRALGAVAVKELDVDLESTMTEINRLRPLFPELVGLQSNYWENRP